MTGASRAGSGRRIVFVIEKLAQRSGGAERVLIETANALAGRGHQVEIVTHEHRGAAPFYPLAAGVILSNLRPIDRPRWRSALDAARRRLERAPELPGLDRLAWFSRNGGFWRRLGRHLDAVRPEVAVAFMPPAVSALALARIRHPICRVASMHNAPEQDFLNPERWDPSRLDRRRRLALMQRIDRITVLLPEYRDWYPPALRDRVVVLPNAVARIDPARRAAAPRRRVVMAVGRLAGVKRHDLLLEAWAGLAAHFPDWELHIFGEGPLRADLERRIAETGLAGTVRLMGHRADIAERYLDASLLAHPAEFEGFPLAVTEALASGLPVVGFADCSGLNRLVRDGVNGLLVPAAGDRVASFRRALADLMRDEGRRSALALAGPGSVEDYAPERILDAWEGLLLGGRRA